MGDFNAACGYVPKKEWRNIRLRTDKSFLWLTGDKLDTSVKASTKCAYDRSGTFIIRLFKCTTYVTHQFVRSHLTRGLKAATITVLNFLNYLSLCIPLHMLVYTIIIYILHV